MNDRNRYEYASRPTRMKTYLIVGGALLTGDEARIAEAVGGVWWRHGRIITGDDHGVNAEVARLAALQGVPCQIVTLNRRPANGFGGEHYLRLIVNARLPYRERLRLRDQFMVQLADYVVMIASTAPALRRDDLHQLF